MERESPFKEPICIHFEKRVVKRGASAPSLSGSKSLKLRKLGQDIREDLIIKVCHFPLPSFAGLQCLPALKGQPCPHGGPYCTN